MKEKTVVISFRLKESVYKKLLEKGINIKEYAVLCLENCIQKSLEEKIVYKKPEFVNKLPNQQKEWRNPMIREGAKDVTSPKWLKSPTKADTPNPVMSR